MRAEVLDAVVGPPRRRVGRGEHRARSATTRATVRRRPVRTSRGACRRRRSAAAPTARRSAAAARRGAFVGACTPTPRTPHERSRVPVVRAGIDGDRGATDADLALPRTPLREPRVTSMTSFASRSIVCARLLDRDGAGPEHEVGRTARARWARRRSGAPAAARRTSIRIGPISVARSRGIRPDANTECSTPSCTTLNAASTTSRFG